MRRRAASVAALQAMVKVLASQVRVATEALEESARAINVASDNVRHLSEKVSMLATLHGPMDLGEGERCLACDTDWPCSTAVVLGEMGLRTIA